jgi:hypothetical protein
VAKAIWLPGLGLAFSSIGFGAMWSAPLRVDRSELRN